MIDYKLAIVGAVTGLGLLVAGCGGSTPVKVPNVGPTSTSRPSGGITATPSPTLSPSSTPTAPPGATIYPSGPPASGSYLANMENDLRASYAMAGTPVVVTHNVVVENGVKYYVVVFSGVFWPTAQGACSSQATAGPVTVNKYSTVTLTSPVSSNGGAYGGTDSGVVGQTSYTCPGNNQP